MSMKSIFALSAVALAAIAVPVAHAAYSASFQGVTFTVNQVSATEFTFDIAGATTATGDWSGVQFLDSFDFKDLGVNFAIASATATYSLTGGTTLGKNSQLNANNLNCSDATGDKFTICFDVVPDIPLAADMLFTIDITGGTLNIAPTGPHLQIAFSNTDGGAKVGSLYSESLGSSSTTSSTSSTSSTSGISSTGVPEPSSSGLALLGLGLLGAGFWARRKA